MRRGDEGGSRATGLRMDEDACRQEERVKVVVVSDGEVLGVNGEWCMPRGENGSGL